MIRSLRLLLACTIAFAAAPAARQAQTPAPVTQSRLINASDDPLLAPFRFRSIGPASMGGRIDDIAVSETDPNYLKDIPSDDVTISISDGSGRVIRSLDGTKRAGINRILWNLSLAQSGQGSGFGRGGGTAADSGTYTVTLEAAGKKLSKPLTLLEDAWMREER